LFDWVTRLAPNASLELRLAARCQHLCRFAIPRESFPDGRIGYLQWRKAAARFHAEKAGEILRGVGYDEATIARVQALNKKERFGVDPEVQVLEDGLCLVFLELQLESFATEHEHDKVIAILQKTWRKMSPPARAQGLALPLGDEARRLISAALAGSTV
jgi:hypothetical protein